MRSIVHGIAETWLRIDHKHKGPVTGCVNIIISRRRKASANQPQLLQANKRRWPAQILGAFPFSAVLEGWQAQLRSTRLTPSVWGASLRTVRLVGIVSMHTGESTPTGSLFFFKSAIPPANVNQMYLPTYLLEMEQ